MNAQNLNKDGIVPINIDTLSFDTFGRNPLSDIVCVTPIRTIVRREEEITIIRRVRKVEEIDASLACPVNSNQVVPVQRAGQTTWQDTT